MDTVDEATRSQIMKSVRQKDTGPEVKLAKALHALGYRYRKSPKGLPGRPDLVFSKYGAAIFIHGCFWHRHGCAKTSTPKTNLEYWLPKFEANIKRDARKRNELLRNGWRVATVWECEITNVKGSDFARHVDELANWLFGDALEFEIPRP